MKTARCGGERWKDFLEQEIITSFVNPLEEEMNSNIWLCGT